MWRLNGDFLPDPVYISGCKKIIRKKIMLYSEHDLNPDDPPEQFDKALASASPLISSTLLHDVILLEARAYSPKYDAKLRRKLLRRTRDLNKNMNWTRSPGLIWKK